MTAALGCGRGDIRYVGLLQRGAFCSTSGTPGRGSPRAVEASAAAAMRPCRRLGCGLGHAGCGGDAVARPRCLV